MRRSPFAPDRHATVTRDRYTDRHDASHDCDVFVLSVEGRTSRTSVRPDSGYRTGRLTVIPNSLITSHVNDSSLCSRSLSCLGRLCLVGNPGLWCLVGNPGLASRTHHDARCDAERSTEVWRETDRAQSTTLPPCAAQKPLP